MIVRVRISVERSHRRSRRTARLRRNALAAVLLVAGALQAQPLPVTDPAFLRAALIVSLYDRLQADCRNNGGFDAAQSASTDRWQAAHGVHAIRARMPELAAHASLERQVKQGAEAASARVLGEKHEPCAAAVAVTRLPDAQFATVAPQLAASAATPGATSADAAAPDTATPRSPAPPVAQASASAALLSQIDSFGFDTRPKLGVGGFVTLDIFPVVLMKSGEALTDVKGLGAPGGLEAHKRAHPEHWTRWRREGGKLQLAKKKGWEPLPFQTTYARLPDDLELDGLYRDLEGSGTIGVGGTQSVTAYDEYRFSPDGTVERTGGAGSSAQAGDTTVTTGARREVRHGRYTVDGLTLEIRYQDGNSEKRILIADPKDPGKAIWLDGVGYVRRGARK